MGTSLPACFPARMAARTTGVCHGHGVAVYTKSMSSRCTSRSKSRSPLVYSAGALRPAFTTRSAARCAFSGTMSASAVISTPSMASSSPSTELPRSPVPTIAIRTVACFSKGTPSILPFPASRGGMRSTRQSSVLASKRAGVPVTAAAANAAAAPLTRSRRDTLRDSPWVLPFDSSLMGPSGCRSHRPGSRCPSRLAPSRGRQERRRAAAHARSSCARRSPRW